jgi:hypothetical protein
MPTNSNYYPNITLSSIAQSLLLAFLFFTTIAGCRAQQGYIGASLQFLDPMTSSQYGLYQGALIVRNVVAGSPAEASGLRNGDIVTSIDGLPMRSPDQANSAILAHRPGSKAKMGIIHPMPNGKNLTFEILVNIGGSPAQGQQQNADYGNKSGNWLTQGNNSVNGNTNIIPVQPSRQGPCLAMLPAGWQMQPDQTGQTVVLTGPNGAQAAWGIVAVNPAMRQYYGDLDGPPDSNAGFITSQLIHAQVQFTSSNQIANFYTIHEFRGGNTAGVVLYHVYPQPMNQYVISEYFAWAPAGDQRSLAQAEAVMTSISCQTQLRPSGPNDFKPTSGFSDHKHTGSSEHEGLKDYNSILGTQYAHDDAGNNFLLDRSSMREGPDGYGYYAGTGVNMHKLHEGLE